MFAAHQRRVTALNHSIGYITPVFECVSGLSNGKAQSGVAASGSSHRLSKSCCYSSCKPPDVRLNIGNKPSVRPAYPAWFWELFQFSDAIKCTLRDFEQCANISDFQTGKVIKLVDLLVR